MNTHLSIVSPVYNSEQSVLLLAKKVAEVASKITPHFEIILVDDRSQDGSWLEILKSCKQDSHVKGIRLSRNFGQHHAITAGLKASSGEYVVVMDCDLQDDPSDIVRLYNEIKKGVEVVYTLKQNRAHPSLKNILAICFYKIFNRLVDETARTSAASEGAYSILSRKVVNEFLKIGDYHRHYLMILHWLGFSSSTIEIEHRNRPYGKSSYNFVRLFKHALNGITGHTNRLLFIAIAVGFGFAVLFLIAAVLLVIFYFAYGFKEGWASLAVVMLLSIALNMTFIGVLGLYVAKLFEQTKGRPLFIEEQRVNF